MLFITPAEFDRRVDVILKLREEEARAMSENLMCDTLRSLGYGTGVQKLEEILRHDDN